jgi:transposase
MEVVYERCCGLDVHKKSVVACLIVPGRGAKPQQEVRTFGTLPAQLLALRDWLQEAGCTHVAMESTGVYWKPVHGVLDGLCEVLLVNARHLKAVPGRKTDVKDAEWIANLLRHGLLRGSFVPSQEQQALRELTRYRSTLVRERAQTVQRLQKTLDGAGLYLSAVVSDITGASARAILSHLVAGERDAETLADLARGRLRDKRSELVAALSTTLQPHHLFLLTEYLSQLDYYAEAIARVSEQIAEQLRPFEAEVEWLDSIPGINRRIAEVLLAEIGTDLARFPSAGHLASWAGLCPGNHESAGQRKSGKTRKGSPWLRQALVEAAHGAARTKHSYLHAQYRRLAARRGRQRALIAVAHSLLVIAYHVLTRHEPYRDLGPNYFDERDTQAVTRRAVRRLEKLGFTVTLAPAADAA